jgi:hypothetical protein
VSNPFYVDGSGNTTVQNLQINGGATGATGYFSSLTTSGDVTINGSTSVSTNLGYMQPKLTNSYNRNNLMIVPDAIMANFSPKDQISWVKSTGTSTNNETTITNTWGYVENSVQKLTFATGTGSNYDMYVSVPVSGYAGQTLVVKVWVKLVTSGMNWNLSVNNALAWNTVGGKTFTSADGLSTTKYTQLSFTFVCPSTTAFNLHIGSHSNTSYGQAAQIAGTSLVYGWQILVKNTTSTLASNLSVDGTLGLTETLTGPTGSFASVTVGGDVRFNTSTTATSLATSLNNLNALRTNGTITSTTTFQTIFTPVDQRGIIYVAAGAPCFSAASAFFETFAGFSYGSLTLLSQSGDAAQASLNTSSASTGGVVRVTLRLSSGDIQVSTTSSCTLRWFVSMF